MKFANNISAEELERIERFLTGDMTEDETRHFAAALTANNELREKTEEVKLLLTGINESALEKKLDDFHSELKRSVPMKKNAKVFLLNRRFMAAASILVILSLTLWWVLQRRNSNERIYSAYYKPDPGLATAMGNSTSYSFEKAMVEYKNGSYDKSLEAWTALLKEKPGNDTLIYFIGAAYQAKKNKEHAIENLKIIATKPESAFYKDACWYLGLLYLDKGDITQAIEYIRQSGYPQSAAVINAVNNK